MALLSRIRHQTEPSIGPARTADRNGAGMSASTDFNRAVDSIARPVTRQSRRVLCGLKQRVGMIAAVHDLGNVKGF